MLKMPIQCLQTAEGALNETHAYPYNVCVNYLYNQQTIQTLLDDRKEIQKEVEQLKSEIDRISDTTEFNTQKLLNGSLGVSGSSN